MKELTPSERRHLEAAEGWLGLENWEEAKAELLAIGAERASHPEVARGVCNLLLAGGEWEVVANAASLLCKLEPDRLEGYMQLATALHQLNRTAEARDVLLQVVHKFPRAYPIHYGLACYACRLGNIKEAGRWWQKARRLARSTKLEDIAREDPDLQALWQGKAR